MIAFLEFAKRCVFFSPPLYYLALLSSTVILPVCSCVAPLSTRHCIQFLVWSLILQPSALSRVWNIKRSWWSFITSPDHQHIVKCSHVPRSHLHHLLFSKWCCESNSLHAPVQAPGCCNHKPLCFYANAGRWGNNFYFYVAFVLSLTIISDIKQRFVNAALFIFTSSLLLLHFPPFRNELHAIVDEVYMLTVFDESVTFHSVLSVDRYCVNLTSTWLLCRTLNHNNCGWGQPLNCWWCALISVCPTHRGRMWCGGWARYVLCWTLWERGWDFLYPCWQYSKMSFFFIRSLFSQLFFCYF